MRWSAMHIPTLREDPAEAVAPSHRLLLRAGYIRQLMAGHYCLLPLAVRVRGKVMGILRQEMDRIGGQELLLPLMGPGRTGQPVGPWDVAGEEEFRLTDRRGTEVVLGLSPDEAASALAAALSSYRELPQIWYQFQTALRDEPRPKAGLLRTREFTMKSSYSFDLDGAGLDRSFGAHYAAYTRAFARIGLPVIAVTSPGGESTEFICPAPAGEHEIVYSPECGYAASAETAASALAPADPEADRALALDRPQRFSTPGVRTIGDLAAGYGIPAEQQIKTLVYVLDGQLTLIALRGDHALEERKLIEATGALSVRPAGSAEIFEALGAHPGSLGTVDVPSGLKILADHALRGRAGMVTGANAEGVHLRGVDTARDINVSAWADLRAVEEGEPCARCGRPLTALKGIEVGHIVKLGRAYADLRGLSVLGPDGRPARPAAGCYGIGVERVMAACAEVHHDGKGIAWPVSVAPFEAVVTVAQHSDAAVAEAGERIYRDLLGAGVDAIIDDRPERAGVKFSDAELIGIPFRVTVGRRGLAAGTAEITERSAGRTRQVPLDEAAAQVRAGVAAALSAFSGAS